MMENLREIEWGDVQQSVPAFLTIALIPLTYSIAYGVAGGVLMYLLLFLLFLAYDLLAVQLGLLDKSVKDVRTGGGGVSEGKGGKAVFDICISNQMLHIGAAEPGPAWDHRGQIPSTYSRV